MPLDGSTATCITTESSADVLSPASQSVLHERELPPRWIDSVEEKLRDLLELERGWDTYGAPPIAADAVETAIFVLRALPQMNLPAPSISPTSAGGVEIEWSTQDDGMVASLEMLPGGSILLYYDDGDEEVETGPDFDPFLRVLSRIAAALRD